MILALMRDGNSAIQGPHVFAILFFKALSHLAGSALRTNSLFGGEITSPAENYASHDCICNEHRLTRTHLADNR